MSRSARAGVFIYAKQPDSLASFYRAVLGMAVVHRADGLFVLHAPDLQLVIQAMPPEIAAGVTITVPPLVRDTAAIKFFFTVTDLAAAQAAAEQAGGLVFPEQWHGPGFIVRNACDPEGNIFQVRQASG